MNERISSILRHPTTVPLVTAITAFASGVGVGYILAKRRAERVRVYRRDGNDYVETLEGLDPPRPKPVIVDEAYLASRDGQDLGPTVTVESEPKEEILEQLPQPESEVELVKENVFANNGDDWNLEEELAWREAHPGEPYVVHKDEFFETNGEYDGYLQHQLTYYAGDDVLAPDDEPLRPIYDMRIVGELKFGHGSGDESVVYIRNEQQRAEYEVMLNPGHYRVEVQGMDDDDREFQHSEPPRVRRMRD